MSVRVNNALDFNNLKNQVNRDVPNLVLTL